MASHGIEIHDHSRISPPQSTPETLLSLTFFDLYWLRFHPVERIFYHTLPTPLSHPSTFFTQLLPTLKTSLSHTLHHFPALAGNVVWPPDSPNPFVKYTPSDTVSLLVALSHADFDHLLDHSPRHASDSRAFVPHLESSNSHAQVLSLQITLFPNKGFTIGITNHHAVLDGKSVTLFLKAWSSLCKTINESEPESNSPLPLAKELQPFFDRSVIKPASEFGIDVSKDPTGIFKKLFPNENDEARCVKLLPFPPRLEDTVRATFVLTRADLEKLKKRLLLKWDTEPEQESKSKFFSKPPTLSSFVVTTAYTVVCIAKALDGVEPEKHKFGFGLGLAVDFRAKMQPPIPDNYIGNCLWGLLLDAEPLDFVKEEGVVAIAKSLHGNIKEMSDKGIFHDVNVFSKYEAWIKGGVEIFGIAGSNRFGVYGIDFGWGKPSKVEIASLDRALTIGLAENKDEEGGLEVGLVLNKDVMNLFVTLFRGGLLDE
ncbi:hypothetical protein Fmac_017440 [Flemingia macrophylla]|uniref:Uncharacterized protein n=1 Tax=Flemingia macrophylla TaxID=520843 RepID=A0ABD1M253_9FABA